jgi:ubiquinone/menaquinone biosynthesis C-methylase UbiE
MKPDEIKRHEREAYDAVAEVYNKSLAEYSARFARDLIDLMFPQSGEAALDIAGGTGAAGL